MEEFKQVIAAEVANGSIDAKDNILLPHNLERFLTARNGNHTAALAYLKQVYQFKLENRDITCVKCTSKTTLTLKPVLCRVI